MQRMHAMTKGISPLRWREKQKWFRHSILHYRRTCRWSHVGFSLWLGAAEEVQRAFYHHHSQSFNILWNFTFRECMSSEGCQWNDPHWGRTTTLLRVITWNGAHYLWMANERFAQELHGVEHWNNNLSNPYSCIGDMDQRRKNTSLLWYK